MTVVTDEEARLWVPFGRRPRCSDKAMLTRLTGSQGKGIAELKADQRAKRRPNGRSIASGNPARPAGLPGGRPAASSVASSANGSTVMGTVIHSWEARLERPEVCPMSRQDEPIYSGEQLIPDSRRRLRPICGRCLRSIPATYGWKRLEKRRPAASAYLRRALLFQALLGEKSSCQRGISTRNR